MSNGWKHDPERLADSLDRLHADFDAAQRLREEQALSLATLTTQVSSLASAVHQMQDIGVKALLGLLTIGAGWVLSVIR